MALHDYEIRKVEQGSLEETLGVPKEGFFDPDGEFPLEKYKSESSINKTARGEQTDALDIGGATPNVDLDIPDLTNSIFPYNQTKETSSGHNIQLDDTIGNERILIKHRTGAGVELRADGSVIIVSKKNKVEVTGSDHTTIVEGHGTLVYKGNLDLQVTGDMNLNVGGDYNVNVGGDVNNTFKHDLNTTIIQDENTTIKGSLYHNIQDDATINIGNNYTVSAEQNYNVNANQCTMSFNIGAIGGSQVDFTGDTSTCSTFHGDLDGCAKEALDANSALQASRAGTAAAIGAGGSGTGGHSVNDVSRQYSPDVTIEDVDLDTDYVDLANYELTTDEVRSKLRDSNNMNNSTFTDAMIALGVLNSSFNNTTVPNTGRQSSKDSVARKGETPIGNTPPTLDSKRFIP